MWESYPANLLNNSAGCPMCAKERFNNLPSQGEQRIAEWLLKNGISYVSEKKFDDCLYKKHLRFDFYIENSNTVIEYYGEQHYAPVGWYSKNEEEFQKMRERDIIKNEYCKQNGIRMIRIPFYDFDNIEKILEDNFKEENQLH